MALNPTHTKGVFVGTDNAERGYSCRWAPGTNAAKLNGSDWLVRPTVQDEEPKGGLTEVSGR